MSVEKHKQESKVPLRFAVITISDTRDASTDKGGPLIVETLEQAGQRVTQRAIVRDEPFEIECAVRAAVSNAEVDLVLTTGGTGIAPRDQTVPTLERLFDSSIPGFGELFRWLSYREIGSAAILSRACAGLIGRKPVIALPGSPKALGLALREIILPEAGHLVSQARGPT
ncbi:MAG: MogA/MoaB family molybdenum cofactor biosynthesis protein [Planctomycetes bacterium]|nr:MogA/MoaB family molybdenum cofactor biosynthesis protein [Planctomycetota bacterium]